MAKRRASLPAKLAVMTAGFLLMVGVAASALFSAGYNIPGAANYETVVASTTPILQSQLAQKGLELGQPIFIRIFKESKELELWVKAKENFVLFKTYPICAYSGELGPKLREGDKQSPEGIYKVSRDQMKPDSRYHLAFNIGFPNAYDQQQKRTGSYLMVHGNCFSVGCYAMTDAQMEEIYLLADAALTNGQDAFQIDIFPFHMTQDNMDKHRVSEWMDFWYALKIEYDYFNRNHQPSTEDMLNMMIESSKTTS